jgi:hypothetical protein
MATDRHTLADNERLSVLLQEFDACADDVRERVHEIVALLMGLHRSLLQRLLELSCDPAHQGSPALVDTFADDPLVGPLLLAHDLHPYDLSERLTRAIDRLRPRLEWSACRATIAGIEPPTVRVRLEGDRLPPQSRLTPLIEATLLEAAPELTRVILEGEAIPAPATPLLQIMRHPPVPASGGAP